MRVFRFLMILLLLLVSPALRAQTAAELLNWTRTHLDRGNCDDAKETYALYKEKVPQGNAEVERRIEECGKFSQSSVIPNQDLTFTVNGVNFKMVFEEGGSFTMGCTSEQGDDCLDREKPAHQVSVSDYYIGETEVTQALWLAVMGNTVAEQRELTAAQRNLSSSLFELPGVGNNYPMYYVSWDDCQVFILKLNNLLRDKLPADCIFSLPKEAEWEYAARGGDKSRGYKYAGSNNIGLVAWYSDNSGNENHPVKGKMANELGLYDMTGNVFEWCEDRCEDYSREPKGDTSSHSYTERKRIWRAGSFNSEARFSRVASRCCNDPNSRGSNVGFRLAIVHR